MEFFGFSGGVTKNVRIGTLGILGIGFCITTTKDRMRGHMKYFVNKYIQI
jgi:hypothetical protein